MLRSVKIKDGYVRTYSDEGFKIRQIETERIFNSAVDVEPCRYTYEETNIKYTTTWGGQVNEYKCK